MRIKVIAAILFGFTPLLITSCAPAVEEVKKSELQLCINEYKSLGISADNALKECNKKSLAECVQRLLQGKFTAGSIKEGPKGYLVDLGSEENRWLEGPQWAELGCSAFSDGPYKRQSDQVNTFWSTSRSYEWFRQGWCATPTLTLEQPVSVEEAKLKCELGMTNPYALQKPKQVDVQSLPKKL